MKHVIILLFLFIASLCSGCRKSWVETDARRHSQFIMENLYTDTVLTLFPTKYFSRSELKELFSLMAKKCDRQTRSGGYKDSFYTWNLGQPDEVVVTYEYKYNCDDLRFDFIYLVYLNSFELKKLRIRNREDIKNSNEHDYIKKQ